MNHGNKKDPIKMLTHRICNGGRVLQCPICSFNYVHIGRPDYAPNDVYEGHYKGRNGALFIPMWCEDGHQWNLILDHHKGETSMIIDNVKTHTMCQLEE